MRFSEILQENDYFHSSKTPAEKERDLAGTLTTWEEAQDSIKSQFSIVKSFTVQRVEPGFRALQNPNQMNISDELADKYSNIVSEMQFKKISELSGSKQLTPSIGFSWHTFISQDRSLGYIHYEDRGMGTDKIILFAQDKEKYNFIKDLFEEYGVIKTPKKK